MINIFTIMRGKNVCLEYYYIYSQQLPIEQHIWSIISFKIISVII